MGRDAAGVIGIRLARKGDSVVGMSVVQPDSDLLVLTETGYGKRVPLTEFRRKHRGGQGVRLIASRAARPATSPPSSRSPRRTRSCSSSAPAARSSGPRRNTINRYSLAAPAASSSCASPRATGSSRIAAFRAGLAEQDGMGDDGDPGTDGASPAGPASGRMRSA